MSRYNPTGDIGVYKVADIITSQLEWIFRPQPFADVGIDAIIEEVVNGEPTGKLIALQIKSGKSFFNNQDVDNFYFRIEDKHYNYWTEFCLPVILIFYNPETELTYWSHFVNHNLINNKLSISKKDILCKATIPDFQNIINIFTESYIQDNFPDDMDLIEMYQMMTKYTEENNRVIREENSDLENLTKEFDLSTGQIESIRIQLTERKLNVEQSKRKVRMIMHNTKISLNVYSNKLKNRLPNYYNYAMSSHKLFDLILDKTKQNGDYSDEFEEMCESYNDYFQTLKESITSKMNTINSYLNSVDMYDSDMQRSIMNTVKINKSYISILETIRDYVYSLIYKMPDEIKNKF